MVYRAYACIPVDTPYYPFMLLCFHVAFVNRMFLFLSVTRNAGISPVFPMRALGCITSMVACSKYMLVRVSYIALHNALGYRKGGI